MKPLTEFPKATAQNLEGVFTDIDDTLTTDGRLHANAYSALEALYGAGLTVLPITGRPAGWCDMIARFWPVAGVVGENGAFYFHYDHKARKMKRKYFASDEERRNNKVKLEALSGRIRAEVPGSAISADQAYREADLAVDFCEDVEPLARREIDQIVGLFEEAGAVAKISSIHINGWFGAYDKLSMTKRFVAEVLGHDLEQVKGSYAFCGDSPNDAPMFGFFPNSVGVANVGDFENRMPSLPAYITSQRGGAGFVEFANYILKARRE